MFSRFPSIVALALFAVAWGFGVSTSGAQEAEDDGQWSPFTEAKGEDGRRLVPRRVLPRGPRGFSLLDRITMLPSLYSNPDNRLVQEIRLLGRYHYSNSGSENSLLVQSRYESEVPEIGDGRAGNYQLLGNSFSDPGVPQRP
jgi:hypothetical protein